MVKAKGYEYCYAAVRIDTDDPDYYSANLTYAFKYNTHSNVIYQRINEDEFIADFAAFKTKCRNIVDVKEQNRITALEKFTALKEELEDLEIDEELILPIFDKIKEMSGMLLTFQPYPVETDPNPEKEAR